MLGRGRRVREGVPSRCWRTVSVLRAIRRCGWVGAMTIEAPTDGEIFLAHLEQGWRSTRRLKRPLRGYWKRLAIAIQSFFSSGAISGLPFLAKRSFSASASKF